MNKIKPELPCDGRRIRGCDGVKEEVRYREAPTSKNITRLKDRKMQV